jgi:hypothetical protein
MVVGAPFFGDLPTMKSVAARRNFPLDRSRWRGNDAGVIRARSRFGEAAGEMRCGRRFFERAQGLA